MMTKHSYERATYRRQLRWIPFQVLLVVLYVILVQASAQGQTVQLPNRPDGSAGKVLVMVAETPTGKCEFGEPRFMWPDSVYFCFHDEQWERLDAVSDYYDLTPIKVDSNHFRIPAWKKRAAHRKRAR